MKIMPEISSPPDALRDYLVGLTYLYSQAKEDDFPEAMDILYNAMQELAILMSTMHVQKTTYPKSQEIADIFLRVASLSKKDTHKLIQVLENESPLH
jgi:hypothetical protein